MKKEFLLFFALLLSYFNLACQDVQDVRSRETVQIIFHEEPGMFPESWYGGEIAADTEPLDSTEMERSYNILRKALEKYPQEVLLQNLNKVYVLKKLNFYGVNYGGTYSVDNRSVFISNSGLADGYTDSFIEQSFHHEFSSILKINYAYFFDEENWILQNNPSARYGRGGIQALKDGDTGQEFEPELNALGFINRYGMSDVENDFNTYAENLFKPGEGFTALSLKYPRVKKKVDILIKFYQNIHPNFNENFFRNLSNL